ncbi:MAG: sulfite exporter TauE/SafE family protein [Bdellovibrionales bacterium]|nr:sulfite exporter TauE/SafE family protein [Bdellovibrionales bacterium]
MQPISLIAVFIASLLGSPHCAGMCGGFVGLYASKTNSSVSSHIAYNLGRLLTYSILGATAGLAGSSLDIAGQLVGFQRVAAAVTGILLIYWGVSGLIGRKPIGTFSGSIWTKLFSPIHRRLLTNDRERNWTLNAFTIGAVSTFLPCGWLYAFAALAAATASPFEGTLVMIVFWTGTLPVMATLGGILNVLGSKGRQFAPRLTAVLFIIAGAASLFSHLDLLPGAGHAHHAHHQH